MEEYRIASALDVRRMLTILLSGLLIFACLLTFNLFQKVHIQESRQEALKGEIRKVFSETFPNTNVIIKGRELDQMKQKIQEESAKLQWLDDIAGSSTVLEILSVLTAIVSGFPDVTVENVSTEEGEVRVDGTASSFETVDRLKEKLSATGSFESVKLAGAKTDKTANLVRFNFGLEKQK
jgi:type II secretory pathway component PulL